MTSLWDRTRSGNGRKLCRFVQVSANNWTFNPFLFCTRITLPGARSIFFQLCLNVVRTFPFARRQFVAFATGNEKFIASFAPSVLHTMFSAPMCAFCTVFCPTTLATTVAYAFPTGLCKLGARLARFRINKATAAAPTMTTTFPSGFGETVASLNSTSSTSTVFDTFGGPTGSTARTIGYFASAPTTMFHTSESAALCMFIAPRFGTSTPTTVG